MALTVELAPEPVVVVLVVEIDCQTLLRSEGRGEEKYFSIKATKIG